MGLLGLLQKAATTSTGEGDLPADLNSRKRRHETTLTAAPTYRGVSLCKKRVRRQLASRHHSQRPPPRATGKATLGEMTGRPPAPTTGGTTTVSSRLQWVQDWILWPLERRWPPLFLVAASRHHNELCVKLCTFFFIIYHENKTV